MKNFEIKSITKKSDDYDEKYLKIKFNSGEELPLNRMIEIPTITIFVRTIFHESSKYYPQVVLDECLHKNGKQRWIKRNWY